MWSTTMPYQRVCTLPRRKHKAWSLRPRTALECRRQVGVSTRPRTFRARNSQLTSSVFASMLNSQRIGTRRGLSFGRSQTNKEKYAKCTWFQNRKEYSSTTHPICLCIEANLFTARISTPPPHRYWSQFKSCQRLLQHCLTLGLAAAHQTRTRSCPLLRAVCTSA